MGNGQQLGQVTLVGGQGTFTTTALPLGTTTLQAFYSGNFDPSSSGSVSHTVSKAFASVQLSQDGAGCCGTVYGQSATVTATAVNNSYQVTATPAGGTYAFYLDGSPVAIFVNSVSAFDSSSSVWSSRLLASPWPSWSARVLAVP